MNVFFISVLFFKGLFMFYVFHIILLLIKFRKVEIFLETVDVY